MITFEQIKNDEFVKNFISSCNDFLGAIGYTEHGFRHANTVSNMAKTIMEHLNYSQEHANLASIAGYLHDIGNVVNRYGHGPIGALLSMRILEKYGSEPQEIAVVSSAIGNHEEETGEPANPVAAAMILADKSDVNRMRVRNPKIISTDIHDRVNYAVISNFLKIEPDERLIVLYLTIDTSISKVMEFFEIFIPRINFCRKSANFLGCKFSLNINDNKIL